MDEERLQILKMVETGQIKAEEAAELLAALGSQAGEPVSPEPVMVEPASDRPAAPAGWGTPPSHWSRFWIYPASVGGGLLAVGALIMGLVYVADAAPGWRVCGWLPIIMGLLVALLAWWSRTARWLHLRISEQGKRKMMLSFPLPLTLAAWVVRIAQPFVPKLKETAVDDLIIALRDSTGRGEPFFLDVEDDEDGEHVQVYIG
jgi:SHOCT-like domain